MLILNEYGLKTGYSGYSTDLWTFHMTWYLGGTSMCNDRELSCLGKEWNLFKTSKTCVLLHCQICLYQAQILIQKTYWISTKTPYIYTILIDLLTKTGFTTLKPDLYKTRIYQFHKYKLIYNPISELNPNLDQSCEKARNRKNRYKY